MKIRRANIDDITQLLPLMKQLGYPENLEIMRKRFEIFLNFNGYGVAVAEQHNKIVGWIAWSKTMEFVSSKVRIRIEGLVVDEKHRRQKIGKKLVFYVEEFATQFNPCIIELTSGIRREKDGTHAFYKSIGYYNDDYMAKLYLRKEISV